MKVILLSDVGGAGRRGEIKDLSDGYVLNFLIPRGLVKQATPDAIASHEKQVAAEALSKKEKESGLAESIRSLHGARIEMKVRATERGGLFKTIGQKEIAHALKEQKDVSIAPEFIKPFEPVKTIGDHVIKVSAFGADSEVLLKIVAA